MSQLEYEPAPLYFLYSLSIKRCKLQNTCNKNAENKLTCSFYKVKRSICPLYPSNRIIINPRNNESVIPIQARSESCQCSFLPTTSRE